MWRDETRDGAEIFCGIGNIQGCACVSKSPEWVNDSKRVQMLRPPRRSLELLSCWFAVEELSFPPRDPALCPENSTAAAEVAGFGPISQSFNHGRALRHLSSSSRPERACARPFAASCRTLPDTAFQIRPPKQGRGRVPLAAPCRMIDVCVGPPGRCRRCPDPCPIHLPETCVPGTLVRIDGEVFARSARR